jgi:phage terminase small subunit
MGVLTNVRFERFAQEIVKGTPVRKAYAIAGYRANKGNASRLRLHQGIKARIAELQSQKTAAVELAQLDAAEKAGLNHLWVLRSLRRNAVMAARRGDTAASNRAIELIGRHLAMFSDRKEIQINVVDDADAYLEQLMKLVGTPVVEHEPVPPAIDHEPAEP